MRKNTSSASFYSFKSICMNPLEKQKFGVNEISCFFVSIFSSIHKLSIVLYSSFKLQLKLRTYMYIVIHLLVLFMEFLLIFSAYAITIPVGTPGPIQHSWSYKQMIPRTLMRSGKHSIQALHSWRSSQECVKQVENASAAA